MGGQFGFEFAIDAPWRLEPRVSGDGTLTYPPIPISVTFHDAVFEVARTPVAGFLGFEPIYIGTLREIRVIEWTQDQPHPRHPVTVIKPAQLLEIEVKRLVSTQGAEPAREICRPAAQNCERQLEITNSHEWHAMFWYTPRAPVTPGRNIHLEIIVVTATFPRDTPPIVASLFPLNEWRNYLVVHAGEAPLPRFGNEWLYGDLHYHAQMTDNEGESGYSYRNVSRALGALGVDFVFATDHASNGVQVDGKIDSRYCADRQGAFCLEARDLNPTRFAAAKAALYGPGGVNEAIVGEALQIGFGRLAADIVPQVYMGEELDAWPEISGREQLNGFFRYGDGLTYSWPNSSDCIKQHGLDTCRQRYSRSVSPHDFRRYLLLDEQGIPVQESVEQYASTHVKRFTPDWTQPSPSRQHIVYFPNSPLPNGDGWIGSDTGRYGGAGKRLQQIIAEVEAAGFAFLAHPLMNDRPGGPAGPDVVPYSDSALNQAWASPAILGLQFWNENDRYHSAPDRISPVVFAGPVEGAPERTNRYSYNWPFQAHDFCNFPWSWRHLASGRIVGQLYHGGVTWDRYLRKGLDPAQTAILAWLPQGEPRKWFMAGGSDGHGDFNFRRYGNPCMDRWCDVPVADSAIANPRNLVSMVTAPSFGGVVTEHAPAATSPKRYGNGQVIDALRSGNFSVTDGPAIRLAIDRNRNGKLDDTDFQMGSTFAFYPGEHIPVLVEWISTPEFGPVAQVDVFVGSPSVTFAGADHGAGVSQGTAYGAYQPDPSGKLQIRLLDTFGWPLPSTPAGASYHGLARLFLGPARFGLASSDGALSYLRASARTVSAGYGANVGVCAPRGTAGSKCGDRFAYSNPIWGKYRLACPRRSPVVIGSSFRPQTPFIDADSNRVPDICEKDLSDPCRPAGAVVTHGLVPGEGLEMALEHDDTPRETPAKPIPTNSCQFVVGVTP